MRLWTFQSKNCLQELNSSGSFRLNKFTADKTKSPDMQYVRDTVITVNGAKQTVKQVPIYCIARVKEKNIETLSLEAFLLQWSYFVEYSKLELLESIMLELEVPEDNILVMRRSDDETSDVKYGYVDYVRNAEEVVEAVIPYINRSWVVSIKTFHFYYRFNGFEVRTEVLNDELGPAWCETVYLANDGEVYEKDDVGNLNKANGITLRALVRKYGMQKPRDYYTISEVLEYCCSSTALEIIDKCNAAGVFKDAHSTTTVEQVKKKNEEAEQLKQLFGSLDRFI